jgi:class 3 adenylate cyclase
VVAGFGDEGVAQLLSLALELHEVVRALRAPAPAPATPDARGGGGGAGPGPAARLELRAAVARGKAATGELGASRHRRHLLGGAAEAAARLARGCAGPGETLVRRGVAGAAGARAFVFAEPSQPRPPPAGGGGGNGGGSAAAGAVRLVGRRRTFDGVDLATAAAD